MTLYSTEEMNSIETAEVISFIYSSQFLERGNRTYHTTEMVHIGGFGPNNLTYSDSEKSKQVNIPTGPKEKDPSTISISELKETAGQKPPRSNRKHSNSGRNTISLDL